jgi:hypothetical protein
MQSPYMGSQPFTFHPGMQGQHHNNVE